MRAIQVTKIGGPDVLELVDVAIPRPAKQEALVKVEYAGVNYIDVYYRTGLYPMELPYFPGLEGAGTVQAIGDEVTEVDLGDRVAFSRGSRAYAEHTTVDASRLVHIPQEVPFEVAAASMLQGMTAHYLTHSTFPLSKNHTCLIHAAAGGVGLLAIQMAKKLGARVFGTVSTREKAVLARDAGIDEVIFYTETDFEKEVRRLTYQKGVEVVYDSVGQMTFEKSLNSLALRGMLVLFGQSSGPVAPFNLSLLSAKGSLFLTRPTLGHYTADRESLCARADWILDEIVKGSLRIRIDEIFPLRDVSLAHRKLESRGSSGKILLRP